MSLFYQLQDSLLKIAENGGAPGGTTRAFVQVMAQSELGLSEHRFPNQ